MNAKLRIEYWGDLWDVGLAYIHDNNGAFLYHAAEGRFDEKTQNILTEINDILREATKYYFV